MSKMKITLSALAISALGSTAFAADFGTWDANADGQVTFDEYSTVAKTEGKTTTLAAQEFMRMAQGDTILTQDEFFLATALADQPYGAQNVTVAATVAEEPMPYTRVETYDSGVSGVEMGEPPVDVDVDVETPESIEAPMIEVAPLEAPAPIVTETPLIDNSAVAGEVITSNEGDMIVLEPAPMETIPMEEGDTDMLDNDVMEPETEMDLDDADTNMDETDIEDSDIY